MNHRSTIVRGALVASALCMAVSIAPAQAQTCGDADGNENVTVTDGVQALRAAAGLSSSCDEACDVDGSGSVTVSDGVNILRKAAGLAINEACEFTAQEANGVVEPSTSIFTAMTKVPGVGSASASALAAGTGPCDNDGSIDTNDAGASSIASFGNCQIGDVVFDGVISRAVLGQGVVIGFDGFTITRVKSGESHAISGQLGLASEREGKRISGKLTITSSERGTFTLQFERILLAGDGSVLQGRLIYDVSKTTGGKIAGILIDFSKAGIPVTVQLRDQQVKQFFFDPDTHLLVPAV
jgi:hypothetical protein